MGQELRQGIIPKGSISHPGGTDGGRKLRPSGVAPGPDRAIARASRDEKVTRFAGHVVQQAREALGVTQGEMGEWLGLTQQGIYKIESGESILTARNLSLLAPTLRMTPETLASLVAAIRVDEICRLLVHGEAASLVEAFSVPLFWREGRWLLHALGQVNEEHRGCRLAKFELLRARDRLSEACAHVAGNPRGDRDYARMQLPHLLGRAGTAEQYELIELAARSGDFLVLRGAALGGRFLRTAEGLPPSRGTELERRTRGLLVRLVEMTHHDDECGLINLGFRTEFACEPRPLTRDEIQDTRPLLASRHGTGLHLPDYQAATEHCGGATLLYILRSMRIEPQILELNLETLRLWLDRAGFVSALEQDRKARRSVLSEVSTVDRHPEHYDPITRDNAAALRTRLLA